MIHYAGDDEIMVFGNNDFDEDGDKACIHDDDDLEPDPTCLQTLAKHWESSALSLRVQTFLMVKMTIRTKLMTIRMKSNREKRMLVIGDLPNAAYAGRL